MAEHQNNIICHIAEKCIIAHIHKFMKDKQGYPQNNFVGYGDMSEESPLQLKTRKKFCPLERIKCGKYE